MKVSLLILVLVAISAINAKICTDSEASSLKCEKCNFKGKYVTETFETVELVYTNTNTNLHGNMKFGGYFAIDFLNQKKSREVDITFNISVIASPEMSFMMNFFNDKFCYEHNYINPDTGKNEPPPLTTSLLPQSASADRRNQDNQGYDPDVPITTYNIKAKAQLHIQDCSVYFCNDSCEKEEHASIQQSLCLNKQGEPNQNITQYDYAEYLLKMFGKDYPTKFKNGFLPFTAQNYTLCKNIVDQYITSTPAVIKAVDGKCLEFNAKIGNQTYLFVSSAGNIAVCLSLFVIVIIATLI